MISHDGFQAGQPLGQRPKHVSLAEVGLAVAAGDAASFVFSATKWTNDFLTHGISPWLKSGKLF